jgi:hypothetical protein
MADYVYRVEFDSISAIQHPSMYNQRTTRAVKIPGLSHAEALASIPEDWWDRIHAEHATEPRARDQQTGLRKLIDEGEWIRNVRVYRRPIATDWEEIT